MRARVLFAGFGLLFGTGHLLAQAQFPQIPQFPGTPITPPASVIPSSPSNPGTPSQPIVPVSTSTPGPFPLLPGSNPGNFPTQPNYQQSSPGGFPQQFSPMNFTPLIPNGPSSSAAQQNPIALAQQLSLPQPENKFAINANDVTLKKVGGGWQLWHGARLLRDFADREADARDALRVYRDLRPTEWAVIGMNKPIVEYGLMNGRTPVPVPVQSPEEVRNAGVPVVPTGDNNRPFITGAGAKVITPIDFHTVRVEAVRGVWCLRDDYNILINFGADKANAEQSLAVLRKYGFNRLGIVGNPTSPAMSYFFAAPDTGAPLPQKSVIVQLGLQSQIENLAKVGIPVAGVGYVGEMTRFDPNKVEVRKEGSEWVVVGGNETLGRFGPTEWIARDAARAIQDARFTEFCKVGSAGLTFFLVDGRSPTRVPFSAQGRQYDLNSLKVSKSGDRWVIQENNRYLFDCANAEEGETLIRVLKYYQFDQLCHLGPSPRLGVSFLARSR